MTVHLPIRRATIEEMERARGVAIENFGKAFDALVEAQRSAAYACQAPTSGGVGFADMAKEALFRGEAKRDPYGRREDTRTHREVFVDEMTKGIDRGMWDHLILATDLERVMDRQAREEFRSSLRDDPPPATAENCWATLSKLVEDRQIIFARGVAKAFSGLDRRFRSHDGFKIGGRIVLDYAFSEYGWNHHRRQDETLRDVERAFYELDGSQQPERSGGILGHISYSRPSSFPVVYESEYFRVRRFKNGNAHVWFKRDDLVRKVNRVLADYYGEVIGEGSDVADTSTMGPEYHVTPARNFGLFETNEETAATLFERLRGAIKPRVRVLEPSAGRGNLADKARALGGLVRCVEVQAELCTTLRGKGHEVTQGDFLTMTPAALGLFDVIVMNPPFDRGRDCDHVRHAIQFLKPGGSLVAIMSAGTEYREDKRTASFRALVETMNPLDRWDRRFFCDLPAGSFADAGTMVNTVTLALRKPE